MQGLLMPVTLRWAKFENDTSVAQEMQLAERTSTEAAIASIPPLAQQLSVEDAVRDRLLTEYREHLDAADVDSENPSGSEPVSRLEQYARLRLAVIARKREVVLHLRDQDTIDDTVLRQLQTRLDIEEVRLTHTEPPG